MRIKDHIQWRVISSADTEWRSRLRGATARPGIGCPDNYAMPVDGTNNFPAW